MNLTDSTTSAGRFGRGRLGGWTLALALAFFLVAPAPAQGLLGAAAPAETGAPAVAADPYGRETPRGLATGLVAAFASGDEARIAQFLQPASQAAANAPRERAELSRRLQQQLDASGALLSFAELSNEPAGRTDDGLPLDQERIGSWRESGKAVPLIARRLQPQGAAAFWVVSSDSLQALAARPPAAAKPSVTALLPDVLNDTSVAGAPLADWLVLVVLGALSLLALRTLFALLLRLLRALSKDPEASRWYQFAVAAFAPLSLYLAVLVFFYGTQYLQVAIVARQALARFATGVGWVAFAWFVWRLIDMVADLWALRMARNDRRRALAALVFVRRSAKAVLGMIAFVAVLDTFGVDVTTGIAALGLGGLALALGAQKTIENLVGSLAVIIDQPVRVGDFCKVGTVVGTIEDIGMRSTQVRTNERTVVTIPNGNFSSQQIENYSRRDRFLFNPVIGLTYDTSPAQMRAVLEAIRAVLDADEDIIEGARARFIALNASSLDIEIFAYFRTFDYAESLRMREAMLLKLMETIEGQGASIAFPTQTLMLRRSQAA